MQQLLGAYQVQASFGLPSIGGKDSMSGINDIDVPPTLVSFADAAKEQGYRDTGVKDSRRQTDVYRDHDAYDLAGLWSRLRNCMMQYML